MLELKGLALSAILVPKNLTLQCPRYNKLQLRSIHEYDSC